MIPEKEYEALNYDSYKPPDTKAFIKDEEMYDFFIEYMNTDNLGRIDNSHLAQADLNK